MRRKLALLALTLLAAGCSRDLWQRSPGPDDVVALVPWFAVMHRGLAIQPYKMATLDRDGDGVLEPVLPRHPVEGTVPVAGIEPLIRVIPSNYAALDRLENPMARTAESLETGRKYFDIFCVPCHGAEGGGDGLVNEKLFIAPSLLTDRAKELTDGMIHGIVRAGRGAMQSYADGVRGEDRWHVVNYVRQLQGVSEQ